MIETCRKFQSYIGEQYQMCRQKINVQIFEIFGKMF